MFDYVEKRINENMTQHTTLHIGGNARWFLLPKNDEELLRIIWDCKQSGIDFFVLGNGSNLLVSDQGFAGAVISMEKFNKIEKKGDNLIEVEAGVNLFELNRFCYENSLGGLEWSFGIPASIGGATKTNCGAFGGEFCKHIKNITVFDGIRIKKRKKIKYAYRKGCLRNNEILIAVTLALERLDAQKIKEKQNEFFTIRKEKQPYGKFSLGSVFKRGEGFLPAKIIDEMGLKGMREGDLIVSEKHAGFIVNLGKGLASDFLKLVEKIEHDALKKGYKFQREFVCLGFDK